MIKWLKNFFLLEDGAVFHRLHVVPESLVGAGHDPVKLHNWKGLLRIRLLFKKVSLPPTPAYVTIHNSYRGYYHWLLESVPKLLQLKRAVPGFTLLIPASYTDAFYDDTLRMLGVVKVERLQPDVIYRVPRLALPYTGLLMGTYSAEALQEVKTVFLKAVGAPEPNGAPKRLYISRRKAVRRKVMNESEVEQLLTAQGFETICFEDYTFEEQVRACAAAEMLVSIHGAGLSNMVFLPAGATVVEFRKFDNGENFFFTQLAATLQHSYHLLYCAAGNEQHSVQDADLWVDIAALKALIN